MVVTVCGFGLIGSCCYHYQLLAGKADHRCANLCVLALRCVRGYERNSSGLFPLTFLPTGGLEEAKPEPRPIPVPKWAVRLERSEWDKPQSQLAQHSLLQKRKFIPEREQPDVTQPGSVIRVGTDPYV